MNLPSDFIARMRVQLGGDFDNFINSYARPAERAIRVNTLKISVENFKQISPFPLESVPWEPRGFYTSAGAGKTVYHAAGLYYVQEPSAMCAAPRLEVKPGERILDLCSAPGGKGTQLAQDLNGKGIIFLNEINFSRAKILSSNTERLGIGNAVVTCAPPEKLVQYFENYFDKILVDAPCSGEGMFKKEQAAIPEWSLANVKACAERQSKILDSAYKMLAGGGRMVYSTCTFAPEEDEEQIQNFVNSHEVKLICEQKLYPHRIRGEGHYYAVIEKSYGERRDMRTVTPTVKDVKLIALYRQFEREILNITFNNLHLVGSILYSLPPQMPQTSVQTLRAGVRLGEFADNRFEPSHSLAMYLKKQQTSCIEVDEAIALKYLRGLTLECGEEKGWRTVTYRGFPLGWCKVSNGVAKNKLPKGLRI